MKAAPVFALGARARLRALAPRYLAVGVMCVLLALGVRSLLDPPSTPSAARALPGADAPSRAFALEFARAYLTDDAARPSSRARALAPYLSDAVDSEAGSFATEGSRRVLWAEIASDQPALLGGRAITVVAAVSTQATPLYLTVTVAHEHDGPLALVGYPAFVGAPATTREAPSGERTALDDPQVAAVIERALRNYLGRSARNLKADLTPGAAVTLPTLALGVRNVERIEWLGGPHSGAALVTVAAADADGRLYTLAYEIGIAMRERPYVDFIEVVPTAG